MLRPAALTGALCTSACLGGCFSSGAQRSAGGILSIDVPAAAGDQRPAEVSGRMQVGERLEIRLGAATGTGYAWKLAGPIPANMRMTTADPAGAVEPGDAKAMPGAPAWTVFGMDAVAQGDCRMRFVLVRPWEPEAEPARRVDLDVEVRAPAR